MAKLRGLVLFCCFDIASDVASLDVAGLLAHRVDCGAESIRNQCGCVRKRLGRAIPSSFSSIGAQPDDATALINRLAPTRSGQSQSVKLISVSAQLLDSTACKRVRRRGAEAEPGHNCEWRAVRSHTSTSASKCSLSPTLPMHTSSRTTPCLMRSMSGSLSAPSCRNVDRSLRAKVRAST